jgi:hypothetical protein
LLREGNSKQQTEKRELQKYWTLDLQKKQWTLTQSVSIAGKTEKDSFLEIPHRCMSWVQMVGTLPKKKKKKKPHTQ